MTDACQHTHIHVRARARGGTVVHALDPAVDGLRVYYTVCGLSFPKDEAVRTARNITCKRDGCVRSRRHERPGGLTVRAGRTKVMQPKQPKA